MHPHKNERMFVLEWKMVSGPSSLLDEDDEAFPLGLNNHRYKWWCLCGFFS